MLENFIETYSISFDTLKKIFPEHVETIDSIIYLNDNKDVLSANESEQLNELESNLISVLQSQENESRLLEYTKANPSTQISPIIVETELPAEEILGSELSEEEIARSLEEPIETIEQEAAIAPISVVEPIVPAETTVPIVAAAPIIIDETELILPEITELEEPSIPIPSEEAKADVQGWMMNETDRLFYENFRLDTIQNLLTFKVIHDLNNSGAKRHEIVSIIKNSIAPENEDDLEYISFSLKGAEQKIGIPIVKEVVDDLIKYGFIDGSTYIVTPLGVKIINLYSKCFPLDTHPFSFIYGSEQNIFQNASVELNVRNGAYVNIDGSPFLYNGGNLFMKVPTNFSSDENTKDEFVEGLINNNVSKAIFEECNASAYCLSIEKYNDYLKFNGGNGMGYVIFSSADKDIYVDSLTFNFLRYKFGANARLKFSYDAQNPDMNIVRVIMDGSMAGMEDSVVAYIVSDEKSVSDFTLKTINGNISDVDMLVKKIRSDYYASAKLTELAEFLDKNIMATEFESYDVEVTEEPTEELAKTYDSDKFKEVTCNSKFLFIGDSLTAYDRSYADQLKDICPSATIKKIAVDGAKTNWMLIN